MVKWIDYLVQLSREAETFIRPSLYSLNNVELITG